MSLRDGDGRREDARPHPKVARSAALDRSLSYDEVVPTAAGHRARFVRSRARGPPVPRPAVRRCDDRRPGARRRAAVRRHRRGRGRAAAGPPPGQRRPPRPAGRGGRRRARRSLPARGPDARGLALGRDAAQGPASVDLRLRADLSRARAPTSCGPSAGSSGGCASRPSGPDSGVLPHERTLAGPREDRYKLLRATGVNTSPVVGLYDDRDGASRPILDATTARARRHRPHRRRRRPPSPVGRAGRRRRGARRSRRSSPRPRGAR